MNYPQGSYPFQGDISPEAKMKASARTPGTHHMWGSDAMEPICSTVVFPFLKLGANPENKLEESKMLLGVPSLGEGSHVASSQIFH
jgi:hypothetical protein